MSAGPPRIFDAKAYRMRRRRAALGNSDAFLAQEAAAHLAERLSAINRRFERGLDLHSRATVFPLLAPMAADWIRTGFAWDEPPVIAGDEALPFAEESFDLVTSVLS